MMFSVTGADLNTLVVFKRLISGSTFQLKMPENEDMQTNDRQKFERDLNINTEK